MGSNWSPRNPSLKCIRCFSPRELIGTTPGSTTTTTPTISCCSFNTDDVTSGTTSSASLSSASSSTTTTSRLVHVNTALGRERKRKKNAKSKLFSLVGVEVLWFSHGLHFLCTYKKKGFKFWQRDRKQRLERLVFPNRSRSRKRILYLQSVFFLLKANPRRPYAPKHSLRTNSMFSIFFSRRRALGDKYPVPLGEWHVREEGREGSKVQTFRRLLGGISWLCSRCLLGDTAYHVISWSRLAGQPQTTHHVELSE